MPDRSPRKKIGATVRAAVYLSARHRCYYCGRKFEREARPGLAPVADDGTWLEIDHIIPVNAGGDNRISNLRAACTPCNKRKSAWVTSEAWEARFAKVRPLLSEDLTPSESLAERIIGELIGRPFSMDEVR